MKTCTRCGKDTPLSNFYKELRSKDGLRSDCKDCSATRNAASYTSHREERLAQRKLYNKINKEQKSAYDANRYNSDKEQRKNAVRIYREANKELVAAGRRRYAATHPEQVRAITHRKRSHRNRAMTPLDKHKSILWRRAHQNDPCFYCGGIATTDDHVMPLSRGGTDHWFNLVRSCRSCNSSKNAKLLSEWKVEHQFSTNQN